MTTYINPTDIISIKVEEFKENPHYGYLKRKSFLGITILEEGLYWEADISFLRKKVDELPCHSVKMGDCIYYKPNVQIMYKDRTCQKHFETYYEAQKYAKDMADKYGLILI